jgi:ATP-dependent helicase STH1/SNF2
VKKVFDEVNGLIDDVTGQPWNIYFKSPVDRKIYPDYFTIIAQPIAMSQIKRKFVQPLYGLHALSADLKLLWNNARTYNTEGSWVYNAAEEMESYFDKRFAEEVDKFPSGNAANGNGTGNGDSTEGTTPAQSGQSTPMYKGPSIGTKIKLNLGGASRRNEVVESEASGGDDDDDDDDDY